MYADDSAFDNQSYIPFGPYGGAHSTYEYQPNVKNCFSELRFATSSGDRYLGTKSEFTSKARE